MAQFKLASAIFALGLLSMSKAISVPPFSSDLALRDLETVTLVVWDTPQNVTTTYKPANEERGLSTDVLVPRANEAIVQGVLVQSAAVAATACSAAVAIPGVCIAGITYAAITGIWALYYAGQAKRNTELQLGTLSIDPAFSPTVACHAKCQLEATAAEGVWTPYANVTANGITHTLQFFHEGTLRGVRAIPQVDKSVQERQVYIVEEFDEDGNFEGSIYWEDGAQTAWADWDRDDDTWAADTFSDYVVDNSAQVSCLDAIDSDGTAFASVFLISTDDEGYSLTSTQINTYIGDCINLIT